MFENSQFANEFQLYFPDIIAPNILKYENEYCNKNQTNKAHTKSMHLGAFWPFGLHGHLEVKWSMHLDVYEIGCNLGGYGEVLGGSTR